MKSLLYGSLLVIICSCLHYTQSTPTFGKEYVHIKLHLGAETRHEEHSPAPHNKVIHHHYHKRRRPVHKYHGAKPSADFNGDDYLESLANKPSHHHNDEPVETYIVHEQKGISDLAALEELGYHQLQDHEDVVFGHQTHYQPQQHVEVINYLKSKIPGYKYSPTVSYDDDSHLETEGIKFHSSKPFHQIEIEDELESSKSHFRPSSYDGSAAKYTSHLSADEDFYYPQKPTETEEFLEIGTIYQPELLKNAAQQFKSHHYTKPISSEYIQKTPIHSSHQISEDYMPDYEGRVRQVVEYPSEEGKNEDISYDHSDLEADELYSSDEELSSHDDTSSLITAGGAIVDWPTHASGHHGGEGYTDIDRYSDTHVKGVGRSGVKHSSHSSKIKK